MDNPVQPEAGHPVVSSESDELILVDLYDNEIGHLTKDRCHDGHGLLHRAFSLFVFDPQGRLLMQQRSADKRLWARYWSNSCCSHPRRGETMDQAVNRRLAEELGVTSRLEFLYKFVYQANFGDAGSEFEYCWVYVGRTSDPVQPNRNEIADWKYLTPAELDRELLENTGHYTPWLKGEWARIRAEFGPRIEAL